MYINCSEFLNTSVNPKICNLSSHLMQAIDIYFISDSAHFYNNALDLSSSGLHKYTLWINNTPYPIRRGYPGEGPLNPIVYTIPANLSKVNFININDEIFASAFAGINVDRGDVTPDDTWDRNTNIDANDYINIKIVNNDSDIRLDKNYGYGQGVNTSAEEDPLWCPYGGFRDDDDDGEVDFKIGYGGYGYDETLSMLQLVIEESVVIRKNFSYLYGA